MNLTLEKLSPWLFTIGLFVLWELACRIFRIDTFVLPAPSQIFEAVFRYWSPLAKNAFVTLWTTLAGFALAVVFGVVLGIIVLISSNYHQLYGRFPDGGGDAAAAGHAFGEPWAFVPLGALIVDYGLTIAISAAALASSTSRTRSSTNPSGFTSGMSGMGILAGPAITSGVPRGAAFWK